MFIILAGERSYVKRNVTQKSATTRQVARAATFNSRKTAQKFLNNLLLKTNDDTVHVFDCCVVDRAEYLNL